MIDTCPDCKDEVLPTMEAYATIPRRHGNCSTHKECYVKCINIDHGEGRSMKDVLEDIAQEKGWGPEQMWWRWKKYGGDE